MAHLTKSFKNGSLALRPGALIEAMKNACPDAGLGIALEIGAKVDKGGMKW